MQPSHSLRRRLPLLISALLCVAIGVFGWSAYHRLQAVLVETTGDRLTSVTRQLAGMLEQSARPGQRLALPPALESSLFRAVAGDEAARREAHALLEETRVRATPAASMALWSPSGERVLGVGPLAADGAPLAELAPASAPIGDDASTAWVGPLIPTDSGVVYQLVAPLLDSAGTVAGTLVVYRRLGSGQDSDRIEALIGPEATVLVGNAAGGLWTDLSRPVDGPGAQLTPGAVAEYPTASGERQLGVAVPIRSTPWLVLVQMPRHSAVAPAGRFVVEGALIALVVVVLGGLAAWRLSNGVTAPLAEISGAARDVARGDYARRVSIDRRDELGSLALSFNSMATQVEMAARESEAHARDLEATNAELRESEQRYRQLIELSPDAIFVHRHDRILFANPAAAALVGTDSGDELVGQGMHDIVQPVDDATIGERSVGRMDGTTVSVEAASTAVTLDAQPAVLTILRDVSERRRLEERVRQAQKMEAVGQLAGGVAHDFNNLLTVITSYSGMLLVEMPAEAPARADIQEISDAAQRAATLTRQLLAFSRQQMLQPQVLDANAVIANMERMLRRVIPADIRLVTRLDPALGLVCVDPGQLEQVVMNLTLNARDAMPDGGTLLIETATVELTPESVAMHAGATHGPHVALTVSDKGSGMTPEQQRRIFEPFFTTKDPGRGTGLGLSTVYGIVQQSGGHVWVHSEPGRGSMFRVYLPCSDAGADCTSVGVNRPTSAGGAETVLLAEDEAHVREAARRVLEGAGYTVLEASSGEEALRLCAVPGCSIDLLLTDIVMPEMSGQELATRFRVLHPTARTVFMSGYTEDAVVRQRVATPGTMFIQKPFTPHSLTEKLREALA